MAYICRAYTNTNSYLKLQFVQKKKKQQQENNIANNNEIMQLNLNSKWNMFQCSLFLSPFFFYYFII